jgi:uncharacterized protein YdhG (YjbR/CyaY superfamily)
MPSIQHRYEPIDWRFSDVASVPRRPATASRLGGVSPLAEYLSTLDEPSRTAFEFVRDEVLAIAPGATEGTSYGMAVLKYRDRPLLGFRVAARHLSIHPFSPAAVDAVRDRLAAAQLSKGTIRFTAAAPLPGDVVRDLVRARVWEIDYG